MDWKWITAILCTYGLLKEFKPIEPYLYRYHQAYMNLSAEDLNSKVYPISTYSYLAFLIPALLLTDVLLYKPILIVESCSYITVWILLIYGRSIAGQQLAQLLYGCALATEIAYFAYIYVKVDRTKFTRVTVWTRAALQVGKCLAYFGSQLIIFLDWGDLLTLNYISLASVSLTLIFALSLPFVSWRTVFDSTNAVVVEEQKKEEPSINKIQQIDNNERTQINSARSHSKNSHQSSSSPQRSIKDLEQPAAKYIACLSSFSDKNYSNSAGSLKNLRSNRLPPENYNEFVCYRIRKFGDTVLHELLYRPSVLKWSIWWALSTCGDLQVQNYIQTLWGETQKGMHDSKLYNGFVEGAIPLITSVVLLALQKPNIDWTRWGELCLTAAAVMQASALLLMSMSWNIYVMYAGYAIFQILYECMITIAQLNIVWQIGVQNCGFIFGVNMFIALLFQTALTIVVVDQHGPFAFPIRMQFHVYAAYHGAIAVIFFGVVLSASLLNHRRHTAK